MEKQIKTFEYGKRDQVELDDIVHHLKTLIQYYYKDLGNLVGGCLHIVLDDGKITEQGTHQELLDVQGIYFDMYERQQLEENLNEIK